MATIRPGGRLSAPAHTLNLPPRVVAALDTRTCCSACACCVRVGAAHPADLDCDLARRQPGNVDESARSRKCIVTAAADTCNTK
jgi:hypothetical protein